MPDVAFVRTELSDLLPRYDQIRDCLELKVKDRGDKYLPRPNSADTSESNKKRFDTYLKRAVFYNVTGRTLGGLSGAIFARDPVIKLPAQLQPIEKDANGSGINLTQEAKEASNLVLAYGRAGLFIDYPTQIGPDGKPIVATKAQLDAGLVRPTINLYKPEVIINWRTKKRGAKHILSLVVLSEKWIKEDDGFKLTLEQQYRVLRIGEDDLYTVEIWREGPPPNSTGSAETPDAAATVEAPKDKFVRHFEFMPTDANGNRLDEIPFTFIGAVNNDPEMDQPPLFDMSELNIAHYRNSADFEEMTFIIGQPTPYFAGLTTEWVKEILNGVIPLGSRAAVPLPEGATAGLLQVTESQLTLEAMQHKERQMVALGAKLVQENEVARTATEANIENTSETSTLASSAKNVSLAFKFALEWCAVFVGIGEEGIEFELNSDFDLAGMDAAELTAVVGMWQQGLLAWKEARAAAKKAGVATLPDAQAKAQIENEMANSPAFANHPANVVQEGIRQTDDENQKEAIKAKRGAGRQ